VTSLEIVVTVDLDSSGKTIGVELVGVKEFNVETLSETAGFDANTRKSISASARYVPASLQVA